MDGYRLQLLVVLGLVLFAGSIVLRRLRGLARAGSQGARACGGCPSASGSERAGRTLPVVDLRFDIDVAANGQAADARGDGRASGGPIAAGSGKEDDASPVDVPQEKTGKIPFDVIGPDVGG
ncbi:MAG: hypothetical protein D6725_06740 [Planctomycetota bacterium]|nr:MAG: hypothetical protein D6725_06740 [Planctomycetota bacterium]